MSAGLPNPDAGVRPPEPSGVAERFTRVFTRARAWEIRQKENPITDQQGTQHPWTDGTPYLYNTQDRSGDPKKFRVETVTGGLQKPQFRGGIRVTGVIEGETDRSNNEDTASMEIHDGYRGPYVSVGRRDGVETTVAWGFKKSEGNEANLQALSRAEEVLGMLEKAKLEGIYQLEPATQARE